MASGKKDLHGAYLYNKLDIDMTVWIMEDGTMAQDGVVVKPGKDLPLTRGAKNVNIKIEIAKKPPNNRNGGSRIRFGTNLVADKVEFNSNVRMGKPQDKFTYLIHIEEIPSTKTDVDANVEHPGGGEMV